MAAAAATAYTKKLGDAKEAKRVAEASNFASETAYPSLGGAAKPVAVKSPMNFKKTVQEMAERVAVEEKKVAAAKPVERVHSYDYQETAYTDGEEDYQEMAYAGDEGDSDGEFNADLVSNRRRGDKGLW